jgi:hypothetical protein
VLVFLLVPRYISVVDYFSQLQRQMVFNDYFYLPSGRIAANVVCTSALILTSQFLFGCGDASNPVALVPEQNFLSLPASSISNSLSFSEPIWSDLSLMPQAENDPTLEEQRVGRFFPHNHPYTAMCLGAFGGGCRYTFDSYINRRPLTLEGLFASCAVGAATAFCVDLLSPF